MKQSQDFPESPLVIAHRGYRTKFPENTLPAFRAAWNAGARMAELDVQWSRDGKLMVHHDATLDRCTGTKGFLSEMDASFLRTLDAGSWFSPEFGGTKIPFLEELVAEVPENAWLNVEVKPESVMGGRSMGKMIAQLAEACAPLEGRVLVSSFHHGFLERCSKLSKPPLLGLLSPWWQDSRAILPLCLQMNAFSWHPSQKTLSRTGLQRMKAFGFRVYPYTVNDEKRAANLINAGADGFFSDDPLLMG
ncbi:hypothetical protein LJC24_05730 [Desulfococcaceae bacterium OttesenSCG-928-F15]|nr:hypothetical protein [Desulfococcaceae bacterium OttesenSCG-928-F15]